MMKTELPVRNVNSHQLYRLLQEPEFNGLFSRTAATIRKQVRAGLFGRIVNIPMLTFRRPMVDLYEAYDSRFAKVISWEKYAAAINRWCGVDITINT